MAAADTDGGCGITVFFSRQGAFDAAGVDGDTKFGLDLPEPARERRVGVSSASVVSTNPITSRVSLCAPLGPRVLGNRPLNPARAKSASA